MNVHNGLVLAGGFSSRMGRDKASLLHDGELLRDRAARCLRAAAERVFLSLRDDQRLAAPDFDGVVRDRWKDIGPAAALLTAYHAEPERSWIVLACDFPLVTPAAVVQLATHHSDFATCFEHPDGTPEPLFAVWTPAALARLDEQVRAGRTGAVQVLRDGATLRLRPNNLSWIRNANTPEEFEAIRNREPRAGGCPEF